jgi:DNA-binding GntR family transcriptional regulator
MSLEHPITLKSLHEQVYDYLKTQLKKGTLSGEGFLDLGALAQTLGVSRTPLRDALLQLEVEGFVTIVPRKGVLVRTLDSKDIQEIYQMVGALEASALLASAPLLTPKDYVLLRSLDAKGRRSVEEGDSEGCYKANFAFHDLFLDRCGNKRVTTSVHTLKQQLYDWNRKFLNLDKEWEFKNLQEHEDIVECLEKGDPGRAAAIMREVHWSYAVQEAFVKKVYFQG